MDMLKPDSRMHELERQRRIRYLIVTGVLLVIVLAHLASYRASEPFYNTDETRHVMTGVYFRDLIHDRPFENLREYTIRYYLQYPALGLLVWPPFFYVVEGVLMSGLGISIMVSKGLVLAFAALACVYLFKLVERSHDAVRAALAVLLFGLSPLVFSLSHYVMLEVPAVALCLASVFYVVRYLDESRRRDLVLAGVAAALAALTRFDALYLVPLFALLMAGRKRWEVLRRREVILVAALAFTVVAPFYVLTAREIGGVHVRSVTETAVSRDPAFVSLERLLFYPREVPSQISWFALVPALVGLGSSLTGERRRVHWPYLAMILAVYMTFTGIGEMDSRHAVYWVPAFCLFAAEGVSRLATWVRMPRLGVALGVCVLAGVAWTTAAGANPFVRGYGEAARLVVANSPASPAAVPYCLFVGELSGDFIYQVRRLDPQRRVWVLRADKLLFTYLESPQPVYKEYARTHQEILDTIYRYDPEFVVVEQPAATNQVPTSDRTMNVRIRRLLDQHPERFRLEQTTAVESNVSTFRGMRLQVFRNLLRNPDPERRLEFEVLMLRRSIQVSPR